MRKMLGGLCLFPQFHRSKFLRYERFFGVGLPEFCSVLQGPFNERSLSQARKRISTPVNIHPGEHSSPLFHTERADNSYHVQ